MTTHDLPWTTLVFDLDGTLVDSAADLTQALNATLATLDLLPFAEAEVRELVGHGALKLIERGLDRRSMHLGEADIRRLFCHFSAFYADHVADHSRIFPGVVAALERFGHLGLSLGVCTNKPETLAVDLIRQLDMTRFFGAVRGGDSFSYKKPDGRHILSVVEELRGRSTGTVMIGDSETDVKAARSAGVPVILVSFGYTPIPARDLGADAVIDHFDQLASALAGIGAP